MYSVFAITVAGTREPKSDPTACRIRNRFRERKTTARREHVRAESLRRGARPPGGCGGNGGKSRDVFVSSSRAARARTLSRTTRRGPAAFYRVCTSRPTAKINKTKPKKKQNASSDFHTHARAVLTFDDRRRDDDTSGPT